MRSMGHFLAAVAEVIVGALVLANIVWGECSDRLRAWVRRRRAARLGCRHGSRRLAALHAGRRYAGN